MFNLFWVSNFIKIRHIAILRPNLPKYNFRSRSAVSNIIFMINELDLLSVPNFIALGYISILGPNFPGMRGLILVLMSNVCYLAVILIFLWLLGGYCSLSSGYCWLLLITWWLLLVTGGYSSLLLVSTFSMNVLSEFCM